MKHRLALLLALAAVAACERTSDTKRDEPAVPAAATSTRMEGTPAREAPMAVAPATTADAGRVGDKPMAPSMAAADATKVAPDNTKKNERDGDGQRPTPFDQGESSADIDITQQIRKGVVAADGMSMAARNVKIITNGGVVTLRGPVETAKERSTIVSIAKRVSGAKRVDNQLEIAAK